ncbi:signal peptidase I [Streptomyces sp. R302]|uniref:signal peptidase I n=1 Tax=unclassified Streptomyces TaxID=2593676 RepID=UPI00145E50E2|nr:MULTISPECIES: signal peptidase I [unclassified Streptomyces]NML53277.1 signal peptidase I [Streptomyces sp. R301]NML78231.1 signal peptidase I [Streptomyces sp. R302]
MSAATKKTDGRGRLGSVLSGLAVAVGCLLFLGGFAAGAVLYRPYSVPTGSMAPTLEIGAKVLAQRVDGTDVRRGDVVVFEDPLWGGATMVKRVVGVGGDTVACCGTDGRLTINGTPVDEPYLGAQSGGPGGVVPDEFSATVPEGSLFLLGDDRTTSLDSRSHLEDAAGGSVPRSAVVARVDSVVWPLSGGVVERPAGFAALPGGISTPGPVTLLLTAIGAGAALILGGAAYGPVADRLGGRGRGAREKVKA